MFYLRTLTNLAKDDPVLIAAIKKLGDEYLDETKDLAAFNHFKGIVVNRNEERHGRCPDICPVPLLWTSWTCHCPNSQLPNPNAIGDCTGCPSMKRTRTKLCHDLGSLFFSTR